MPCLVHSTWHLRVFHQLRESMVQLSHETLSHITDDGLLLNFDASSGYLPINLQNVLISFLREKPWLKSLSASIKCREKKLS